MTSTTSLRRAATTGVTAAVLLVLAGCGSYDATQVPAPPAPAAAPAAADTLAPCDDDGTQVRSYAPQADAADSDAVRRIRDRGRLVAGVAADTLLLGARDPGTGQLEGFDIDMALAIAAEIFPGEDPRQHVDFRVITAADRIPLLQDHTIDVVARNMTVNCRRWQQIAFSAIYYEAGQRVLVGTASGITKITDLAGRRICAPAGTTSIDNIQQIAPEAVPVTSTDNAACMVLFQNGEADGVSTDDTVLAGLAAQDPYATVIPASGKPLTQEPYGIGVNRDDVGLVQLINQVLEDMSRDGRWQDYYARSLGTELRAGTQPEPLYGR